MQLTAPLQSLDETLNEPDGPGPRPRRMDGPRTLARAPAPPRDASVAVSRLSRRGRDRRRAWPSGRGPSPATITERYGEFRDFRNRRGWESGPIGTITDDTQLTMEIARCYVERGHLDPAVQRVQIVGRCAATAKPGVARPRGSA